MSRTWGHGEPLLFVLRGLWSAGGPRRLHPVRTNQTQRTSQQRQSRCLFPVLGSWVFQSISHAPDVTKASFFETIWLKIMRLSLLLWAQGEKNINTSWSGFSLKLIKLELQGLSLLQVFFSGALFLIWFLSFIFIHFLTKSPLVVKSQVPWNPPLQDTTWPRALRGTAPARSGKWELRGCHHATPPVSGPVAVAGRVLCAATRREPPSSGCTPLLAVLAVWSSNPAICKQLPGGPIQPTSHLCKNCFSGIQPHLLHPRVIYSVRQNRVPATDTKPPQSLPCLLF